MKLEIRYRMIDWWTDHIRLEISRSSDSREERIDLMRITKVETTSSVSFNNC